MGSQLEGSGAPEHNSGLHDVLRDQSEFGSKSLPTEFDQADSDSMNLLLNAPSEVKVTVTGHDHLTDFCSRQ